MWKSYQKEHASQQAGPPLTSNYTLFNLAWPKEKIYALGTWFYKDVKKGITKTYEDKIDMIANILHIWSQRSLTWLGKITVLSRLYA